MAAVFHTQILLFSGSILVTNEPPRAADAAVVLAGDYSGLRVLKAAELCRQHYVSRVVMGGSGSIYGRHEAEVAIDFAVSRGYPRDAFVPVHYGAHSTEEELREDLPALRSLGARSILLVTSPSHTGRATRMARAEFPGIEIHTVAADDPFWENGYWWRNREGRKTWLYEILKNIAWIFHI